MQTEHAPSPVPRDADASTTDAELLERIRHDGTDALQRLVDRLWEPLYSYARRLLASDDAAEDVVQCAFIRLWERRRRWRPDSDPKLILYTLVRNLALNQIESERARSRRGTDARLARSAVPTPAQVFEERELVRAIEDALSDLPPRRREALILARFHHMTHAEIAEVMGLAQRTVTNHISMALSELEVALARYLER